MLITMSSLILAASAPHCGPGHPSMIEAWRTDGFANPESVISDGQGGFFVSNVNGGGSDRDGNGFIARINASGEITDLDWVSGLDAPKGLARTQDRLFATDIDQLIEVDLATGRVIARHPIEGAQFLNDAAALPDGEILVSDSAGDRIYSFDAGVISIWMEGEHLDGVNGLLPEEGRLLVTTMARGELLAIDWDSRSVEVLATGLTNADGIARWCDGYILAQWPGIVSHISARGRVRTLLDQTEAGVLMNDIIIDGSTLLIPNWNPGSVWAFQLTSLMH
ncbi:MAG: hypothetical protein GYB36_04225 [Alphaproteobacteria bacterium]|nr:hypothetical protein [Alphaproteobacteria bacterium]